MATFFSLQPCVHSSFGTAFGRPRLKAVRTLWVRSRKNAKPARNVAEAEADADADEYRRVAERETRQSAFYWQ